MPGPSSAYSVAEGDAAGGGMGGFASQRETGEQEREERRLLLQAVHE